MISLGAQVWFARIVTIPCPSIPPCKNVCTTVSPFSAAFSASKPKTHLGIGKDSSEVVAGRLGCGSEGESVRELEGRVGRDDLCDIRPGTIEEPVGQVHLCGEVSASPLSPLSSFSTLHSEHLRETSRVKFSTVPGWTRPMLSFHPWNRLVLFITGPVTGWNKEATVSR